MLLVVLVVLPVLVVLVWWCVVHRVYALMVQIY